MDGPRFFPEGIANLPLDFSPAVVRFLANASDSRSAFPVDSACWDWLGSNGAVNSCSVVLGGKGAGLASLPALGIIFGATGLVYFCEEKPSRLGAGPRLGRGAGDNCVGDNWSNCEPAFNSRAA